MILKKQTKKLEKILKKINARAYAWGQLPLDSNLPVEYTYNSVYNNNIKLYYMAWISRKNRIHYPDPPPLSMSNRSRSGNYTINQLQHQLLKKSGNIYLTYGL